MCIRSCRYANSSEDCFDVHVRDDNAAVDILTPVKAA